MSKRIHSRLKTKLGELLGEVYVKYGRVAPRKPYREDDGSSGEGDAKPVFLQHPFLKDMPVGASSDLTNLIENNRTTLDEAERRNEELANEPRHQLAMRLGNTPRKKYIYEAYMKPI